MSEPIRRKALGAKAAPADGATAPASARRPELHSNPIGLPHVWIWKNYWEVITSILYWRVLCNSLLIAFAVTITVSSWGQFTLACLSRPLGRSTPVHLMRVLREAHERGILRQSGMYYQFRHRILQDRLQDTQAGPEASPPPAKQ